MIRKAARHLRKNVVQPKRSSYFLLDAVELRYGLEDGNIRLSAVTGYAALDRVGVLVCCGVPMYDRLRLCGGVSSFAYFSSYLFLCANESNDFRQLEVTFKVA